MKRSEINDNIALAKDFFEAFRFQLPKWAGWGIENWEHSGPEVAEIKARGLGWDVTDFGLGNFREQGLVQFILRNGSPAPEPNANAKPHAKPHAPKPRPGHYSEKIILLQTRQVCPLHFLKNRPKDLINRNGGDLVVQVYRSTAQAELDETRRAAVWINGISYNIKPGALVRLAPGDSMTLEPRYYHKYWADKSGCVLGEISLTCDEVRDYHFHDNLVSRFPEIEEDAVPMHLLYHEYPDLD